MNLPKYYLYSILLAAAFVFLSCDKGSDDVCHGCGIDTTVKEYQFNVGGQLFDDCSGSPASNRTLELDIFYKQDTLKLAGQTNEMGNFSFTYSQMLPGDYIFSASWESYTLLKVKEDSLTFFMNGLENHRGLDLKVNDSLDVSIYLNVLKYPFNAGDTIFLRFEPPVMAGHFYPVVIGGPLQDPELIYTIKDKWRFVILGDYDEPVFKFDNKVVRSGGQISTGGYLESSPKVSCVMTPNKIDILIP